MLATTISIRLGIGGLLLLPFWLVAIGWLSSRILGVHVGRLRAGVAALLGWFIGIVAAALVVGGDTNVPVWVVVVLTIFFGVLATLPFAIILDIITRSGRPPRRRRRRPIKAVHAAFAPLGRFRQVLGNARRENLLHRRYASGSALGTPDFARRLRKVLEDSGGMFVKFGQIASTRTDLLPETLTSELANLQSDVRPVPPDALREQLETELGEPVEQAFDSFAEEPLAAASIGQTHRAKLKGGSPVVVKVQRPGIDDIVDRDAAVLAFAASQIDRRVASAHRFGVKELAGELIIGIEAELSYTDEANAGMTLRANRERDVGVDVPLVHTTLSTERVLVMDEVLGRPVSDATAVDAAAIERPELARRLLQSMLGQIIGDGLYHADPHPGNVMVSPDGTLWLLDFGAVGRLDPVALEALQGIALGFTMRDASIVARAVRHLTGEDIVDLRPLERDLAALLGEVGTTGGLSPAVMSGVLDAMDRHDLKPPGSMVLLARTLLTLEGTLHVIDPSFELAREANELIAGPSREELADPEEVIRREILHALPALRTLPDHAETLAGQLRAGRLSVRTEHYAGNDRHVVDEWVNRVLVAAIGGIGALCAAVLLVAGSLANDTAVRDVLWSLGFTGLTFGLVLLMRSAAQSLRRLPLRVDR
ncbi:MAG TPA: AarF/UbiB family protein [Solirubrobacteraceae bacterium]|nr:AarF/UbiB family protein [Solirubrobacteraceae bacterium]